MFVCLNPLTYKQAMKKVYTITSSLHDEASVSALSDEFLSGVFPSGGYSFGGADFSDFGSADLSLIYVRTGGAEGIFLQLLPQLMEKGVRDFYLLTSGKSNSLAASLEILSYLRLHGLGGEVLHGKTEYLRERISLLEKVETAKKALCGKRIGIIGKPSDWLIASGTDPQEVRRRTGIVMEEIPMAVLLREIEKVPEHAAVPDAPSAKEEDIRASYPGAVRIYEALSAIVERHCLDALTLRCFDLLTSVGNTGCISLSRFNSEGIPASCEGDIPALLTMMIVNAFTGISGFQANPASIDVGTGEVLFAHCTIPFNMVDRYNYDTHFESGIGVGIHGHFPEGPVTVFKVSGDLSRAFIAEGELIGNQYEDNLCRTQVRLRIDISDARYFLTDPIGNHHIIVPGRHGELFRAFVNSCR